MLRQLYAGHALALRSYVLRFTADQVSADDTVQETFIRAWRHLPELAADERPVRPWLFRVTRNLLIDADRASRLAAGLVAAGLASAALSLAAARGSYRHRRCATWAAVLIGITSAPQAAATGFDALYAVPNTATAILGILLTVTVLATVGRGQPPG